MTLRVDGGMKTGRDVVMAALLGAEEFGFGTAAMVAAGCIMARQCHLDTCPVGIASQRPELRERYPGRPEHVMAFFRFVARQVRGSYRIGNRDRSVGARLSGEIARRFATATDDGSGDGPGDGLPRRHAGARLPRRGGPVLRRLPAPGRGLHPGGRGPGLRGQGPLRRRPGARAAGRAGERLCVRNSGAVAVVEGCGDHGCEYMTRGVVVVLGDTGCNFGAGMSGGVAYVLDPEERLPDRVNPAMVEVDPELDAVDRELLFGLVETHQRLTGSARAAELLETWDAALRTFRKVVPQPPEDADEADVQMRLDAWKAFAGRVLEGLGAAEELVPEPA